MSLATYTDLQASLASWLHRSDLTSRIPDFIALAEAQMNRRLRVRRMMARATATLSDEYSAVPSDFLGPISITIDGEPLAYLTVEQMDAAVTGEATGAPAYYTVTGGEFRYYPAPGTSYTATLTYWQAIPALASNSTNWLLTNHPDAYLYGSLTQAAPYIQDDERTALWAQLFQTALNDALSADMAESHGALTPVPNGFAY